MLYWLETLGVIRVRLMIIRMNDGRSQIGELGKPL
jgi:hypothetical protein